MARFFFHVRDSVEIIDRDGIDCAGSGEARAMAVKAAADALRDLREEFWNSPEWRMWVTDESGETVCSLRFSGDPFQAADRKQSSPALRDHKPHPLTWVIGRG
jgi:hypothetical protein